MSLNENESYWCQLTYEKYLWEGSIFPFCIPRHPHLWCVYLYCEHQIIEIEVTNYQKNHGSFSLNGSFVNILVNFGRFWKYIQNAIDIWSRCSRDHMPPVLFLIRGASSNNCAWHLNPPQNSSRLPSGLSRKVHWMCYMPQSIPSPSSSHRRSQ